MAGGVAPPAGRPARPCRAHDPEAPPRLVPLPPLPPRRSRPRRSAHAHRSGAGAHRGAHALGGDRGLHPDARGTRSRGLSSNAACCKSGCSAAAGSARACALEKAKLSDAVPDGSSQVLRAPITVEADAARVLIHHDGEIAPTACHLEIRDVADPHLIHARAPQPGSDAGRTGDECWPWGGTPARHDPRSRSLG